MWKSTVCALIYVFCSTLTFAQSTSVIIAWDSPTQYTDGSPLENLDGFKIYYGTQSGAYPSVLNVGNVSTGTVSGLNPALDHFFSVTAYDEFQVESAFSSELIWEATVASSTTTSTTSSSTTTTDTSTSTSSTDTSTSTSSTDTSTSTTSTDSSTSTSSMSTSNSTTSTDTSSTSTSSTTLGESITAWEAAAQNPSGAWENSGWKNRSFRILLDGSSFTNSGGTVTLTLQGRADSAYTIQRVSLVKREGETLDGVDESWAPVTFGADWNSGVTVPVGGTAASDAVPFDLAMGQDVFLTYWVPSGEPTVFRSGGSDTTAWSIVGDDESTTVDWQGLTISDTRQYVYVARQLDVLPSSVPTTTLSTSTSTTSTSSSSTTTLASTSTTSSTTTNSTSSSITTSATSTTSTTSTSSTTSSTVAATVERDYNGDGVTDIAVHEQKSGKWWILYSDGSGEAIQWDAKYTRPAPADFDGDGVTDPAVFNPFIGEWNIRLSSGGEQSTSWGWWETDPVPADYDGDGKADLAVYWPEQGLWYILQSTDGKLLRGAAIQWGWHEAVPVPGDYDGDGLCDLAVYAFHTGDWYILYDDGTARSIRFGAADMFPVPSDYDGDGKCDIGVFHPATGDWYIERSSDGDMYHVQDAGRRTTVPIPGDHDGDGLSDMCVFNTIPRDWYFLKSTDSTIDGPTQWGPLNAKPVIPVHIDQLWYDRRY